MGQITKINKGDKFVCISTAKLDGAIVGKVYRSDSDGSISLEPHFSCGLAESISSDDIALFNQHFIPYTYEAIWERYKAAKDIGEAEPYANLLRELERNIGRWSISGGNYPANDIMEYAVGRKESEVVRGQELPAYYDNSKGSLYQIAEQRGWNAYTFDIIKRLDRGGKKDPLEQEIRKSIGVLELWLKEIGGDKL
ncbi:MAG: hypothetical protein EOO88_31560 [Pedobacter sp.]|nr:MAG: hypothetical protein EOO88_31560 [Pedobacter sp.]